MFKILKVKLFGFFNSAADLSHRDGVPEGSHLVVLQDHVLVLHVGEDSNIKWTVLRDN